MIGKGKEGKRKVAEERKRGEVERWWKERRPREGKDARKREEEGMEERGGS